MTTFPIDQSSTTPGSSFAWRARRSDGEVVTGTLVAADREAVADQLRHDGLIVTAIKPAGLHVDFDQEAVQIRASAGARRIKTADVAVICQQMGVMLDTGVPLPEALEAIERQARKPEVKALVRDLHTEVCGGTPLSRSMAARPKIFPPVVVSLVKASEASGTMALMLDRVGEYLTRELRTKRQVTGALTYPGFMLGTAFAVVAFMLVVILPRFARIYEMKAATLPTPTKIMMAAGDFMREDWMFWAPALVGGLIALLVWRRSEGGRRMLDWMWLRLPVIGPMVALLYVARTTRTMATLLAGGVGLLDVIRICRGITNNRAFDALWVDMESRVRDGKPMSGAFADSVHIPPDVASMIASGERSGRLPEVMEKVASRSDDTLEAGIKRATSMIEPVLIVVMGIIVGSVAMALLLPVFKMSSVV